MTPKEELEYLQHLVAVAESIATLSDGDLSEGLTCLIWDKIASLTTTG